MTTENTTLPFISGRSVRQMHTHKQKQGAKKHPVTFAASPYPTIYTKLSSAEGKKKKESRPLDIFSAQHMEIITTKVCICR